MPDQIKVVKPGSSAGGVNVDSPSTDDLAKVKADNERMKGALASLQTERDEAREEIQKFRAIEERRELTAREEKLKRDAQSDLGDLDEQIGKLRSDPGNKVFFKWLEREFSNSVTQGVSKATMETLTELAADFLEEKAEELSLTEEFKDMTEDKLFKGLKVHFGKFEKKNPFMKIKKAFREWKAEQEFKKEKAELAIEKARLNGSQESGGRMSRADTLQDAVKAGDRARQRELLGISHKPR